MHGTIDIQIRRDKRVSELISLLPPISDTVSRLLNDLAREDFSLQALSELIEKDAALAAQVLRVANSPLYARRVEVCSVAHAISVLGAERLRNIALTLSVNRLINQARLPKSLTAASFNSHCLATATMSDMLAQRVNTSYPEGAFAAGLLHGIGKLVIALVLVKEYDAFCLAAKTREESWEVVEKEWMGFTHSEIANIALQKWRLPPEMRTAIVDSTQETSPNDATLGLGRVLTCAHDAVNALGYGVACCMSPGPESPQPEEIIERLGCPGASRIVEDFKTQFEKVNTATA